MGAACDSEAQKRKVTEVQENNVKSVPDDTTLMKVACTTSNPSDGKSVRCVKFVQGTVPASTCEGEQKGLKSLRCQTVSEEAHGAPDVCVRVANDAKAALLVGQAASPTLSNRNVAVHH